MMSYGEAKRGLNAVSCDEGMGHSQKVRIDAVQKTPEMEKGADRKVQHQQARPTSYVVAVDDTWLRYELDANTRRRAKYQANGSTNRYKCRSESASGAALW
jgi:hypothetical protein